MKTTQSKNQMAFNFDALVAATAKPQSLTLDVAMCHIADRAHTKLDLMLQRENLESSVSLVIKDDEKDMLVSAMKADNSNLTEQKLSVLTEVANMALEAKTKVYLSYQTVDQLFNAVSH